MERYELLMNTSVDVGHGRQSLLFELIDGWAGHIARLWDEAHQADTLDAWGVHDYVAALYLRSRVERGLSQADITPPAVLRVADQLFREFTVVDESGVLARIEPSPEPSPGNDGWWWSRIPKLGPVAGALTSEIAEPDP